MVSEEVRDRLDHLPHAILRLAARQLLPEQRLSVYKDIWLPDLAYILKGDQSRPVTRLYHGTRWALGILVSARRVAVTFDRPDLGALAPGEPVMPVAPGLRSPGDLRVSQHGRLDSGGWTPAAERESYLARQRRADARGTTYPLPRRTSRPAPRTPADPLGEPGNR